MPGKTNTLRTCTSGNHRSLVAISFAPDRQRAHLEMARVRLAAAQRGEQHPRHLDVLLERHAERGGDAVHGDVVVCRADAARGQHVVERGRELAHVARDLGDHVGDHVHARHVDTLAAQLAQQVGRVLVLDLPRQDLVADDDDPGGGHRAIRQRRLPILGRVPTVRFLPKGVELEVPRARG